MGLAESGTTVVDQLSVTLVDCPPADPTPSAPPPPSSVEPASPVEQAMTATLEQTGAGPPPEIV